MANATTTAPSTYTVIGFWIDDEPLAAGAVLGEHEVAGDLDYDDLQPWAACVEAADADEAMQLAVNKMQDDEDAENDAEADTAVSPST